MGAASSVSDDPQFLGAIGASALNELATINWLAAGAARKIMGNGFKSSFASHGLGAVDQRAVDGWDAHGTALSFRNDGLAGSGVTSNSRAEDIVASHSRNTNIAAAGSTNGIEVLSTGNLGANDWSSGGGSAIGGTSGAAFTGRGVEAIVGAFRSGA